jgi:DNA polymerase III subunit delta
MIVFIHGPDRFLAFQFARERAAKLDPAGENTSWLDARESSLDALIAAIGAVSLFGGTRVVVVSDFLGRASRDSSSADTDSTTQTRPAKADQSLARLLGAVPEDNCLILLDSALSSPPAALKGFSSVNIIAAEPPRGAPLLAWIAETANRAETRIERAAAQLLAETLFPQTWSRKANNPRFDRPPDMGLLSAEIDKLALYAHPDPITVESVRVLVSGGPDQRIFRFLDAALSGDLPTATSELERLEAAGEEPAMVLAQMHGQIEMSAIAQAAGGRDPNTVARDLGTISASRVSAAMNLARRSSSRSNRKVERADAIDRQLKTGHIRRPTDAVYDLMLDLWEPGSE